MKREYYVSLERIAANRACSSGRQDALKAKALLAPHVSQIPFTEANVVVALTDGRVRSNLDLGWLIRKVGGAAKYDDRVHGTEYNKLDRLQDKATTIVDRNPYYGAWTAGEAKKYFKALDALVTYREELEEKYNYNFVTEAPLHA